MISDEVRSENVRRFCCFVWRFVVAIRSVNPHVPAMDNFDFNAPAEVFAITRDWKRPHSMTYRRFFTGAEAIRHVMEVLHADTRRGGTVVETDAARFGLAEIRILYERADYPLPRREPSRSHGASCTAPT